MSYTLTVDFILPTPDTGAYRVKFWPTNDPTNITTRMVSNPPFQEYGLPYCEYSGTIESVCGHGQYSTPVAFSVSCASPPDNNYYYYITKFDCSNNCAQVGATGGLIGKSSVLLNVASDYYYRIDNFTYHIEGSVPTYTGQYDVDLDEYSIADISCSQSCNYNITPTVTGVYGYMGACIGSTLNEYMGVQINLSAPVETDTGFEVAVYYLPGGYNCGSGTQSTQIFNVTILAGQSSGVADHCSNGVYFPGGAAICGSCIIACNNPNVQLSTFHC